MVEQTATDEQDVSGAIVDIVPAGSRRGRLRVALCLDSLSLGGTELNAVRTAEHLRQRGTDAVLVVLRAEGPLLERCRQAGVPVIPFAVPPLSSPRALLRGLAMARMLRALGVDLVHTQDRYSNAFVVPCARAAGLPVLASRRWWDVQPSRALGAGNRVAYRLAHGVVANSERVAGLVHRVDGVARQRITVIPNFLDDAYLEAGSSGRADARRLLGLPAEALVIGSVANLRPVKDQATLLDAVARLVGRWPDLMLCLVGEGESRGALEQQAAELGIAGNVHFAGSRPASTNWHAAFDVSVLTSRSEGFPNSVVEAMAAAKPVVATDVGGVPDAVRHGETGYLVESAKAEPLADALAALLSDDARRAAFGAAGRAEAGRRFSAAAVLPAIEMLYRSYAARRAGMPAPAPAIAETGADPLESRE